MTLDELLSAFPGARRAYEGGGRWRWDPRFVDGHPCPVSRDGRWRMMTCHPGYRVDGRRAFLEVLQMSVVVRAPGPDAGEPPSYLNVYEIAQLGRSVVDLMTEYTVIEDLTMPLGDDVAVGNLLASVRHQCWHAARNYYDFARLGGTDPLRLCTMSELTDEVADAALGRLVSHLSSGHATLRLEGAGVRGDGPTN